MKNEHLLTEQETSALWLLQRRGGVLEVRYALKITKAQTIELIANMAEKLDCPLMNPRDINNGKFCKAHGVPPPPFGER